MIAYCDDICIAVEDSMVVDDIISFAENEFAKLGLQLNRTKCKCTRKDIVDFMGVSFNPNKQIEMMLAPELLKKNQELIETLTSFKHNNVPHANILKFVRHILIPSVNYGAFIDPDQSN